MQFASRTCELGVDTICETCEVCEFQEMGDGKGTAAQKACERDKRYFAWQEANCCKDRSGRKVKMEVDMILSSAIKAVAVAVAVAVGGGAAGDNNRFRLLYSSIVICHLYYLIWFSKYRWLVTV